MHTGLIVYIPSRMSLKSFRFGEVVPIFLTETANVARDVQKKQKRKQKSQTVDCLNCQPASPAFLVSGKHTKT